MRGGGIHVVWGSPSENPVHALCEDGLVSGLLCKPSDIVVVNELCVREGFRFVSEIRFYGFPVLLHVLYELSRILKEACQGVVICFVQELHPVPGKGFEHVQEAGVPPLGLLEPEACYGESHLERLPVMLHVIHEVEKDFRGGIVAFPRDLVKDLLVEHAREIAFEKVLLIPPDSMLVQPHGLVDLEYKAYVSHKYTLFASIYCLPVSNCSESRNIFCASILRL